LAEANGNEKTILLSLPAHLCGGLVKKLKLALAEKTLLRIMVVAARVGVVTNTFIKLGDICWWTSPTKAKISSLRVTHPARFAR
jgi:hypothetical protein